MLTIHLDKAQFHTHETLCVETGEIRISTKKYRKGIESLTIANSRGHVEVLPFMGQIIWDAEFDGRSLRMKNMFTEPGPAHEIVETYGCFAFHSGLLAAGVPSPEDTHMLHGEFATAPMDHAWLEVDGDQVRVVSEYEYTMGFGHHYRARPSLTIEAGSPQFHIGMEVTNLSEYAPMPLQYMCHMNYAFVPDGVMSESLPDGAFQLRRTIPAHVTPTERWTKINEAILAGEIDSHDLSAATEFDPEIVYLADDLAQYGPVATFELTNPDGVTFMTRFSTNEFSTATRWVLYNPDQQVAAFVLPGTSRPEGFLAAQKAGTLIMLEAGATRRFDVTTGIKED
ncbi:aldose 1-epimerase family protein [Arcanobacterium canis]